MNTSKASNLSPQQARCVELLLEGRSDSDIAFQLGVNTRTVKGHLRVAYLKYGIPCGPDTGPKRIKLAVAIYYERHPSNVPFSDGDRAGMCGQTSASVHAAIAEYCSATKGHYTKPVRPRLLNHDRVRQPATKVAAQPMQLSANAAM